MTIKVDNGCMMYEMLLICVGIGVIFDSSKSSEVINGIFILNMICRSVILPSIAAVVYRFLISVCKTGIRDDERKCALIFLISC